MDNDKHIQAIKAAIETSAMYPATHEVHLSSTEIGTRKTVKLYGNVEADVLRFDTQTFVVIRHYSSPIAVLNWWWDNRVCFILSHCGDYRHSVTTSKAQKFAHQLLSDLVLSLFGNQWVMDELTNKNLIDFVEVPVTPQALTYVTAPILYSTITDWARR